jgi:lycopene cyclase domain-containing protein
MPGEYTLAAALAAAAVVGLELTVLRTGLFREPRYWVTIAIVFAFQVPVDGLLTHGTPPVVSYSDAATSGVRFPAAIPVEDYAFGYALVTLTLLLWRRSREPRDRPGGDDA